MPSGVTGVRFAHRSGHGAFAQGGLHAEFSGVQFLLVDFGYVYRLNLAGNYRVGIALDLMPGLSLGSPGSSEVASRDGSRLASSPVGAREPCALAPDIQ